jgi:hypothetical protein
MDGSLFMRPGAIRRLTPGERALAHEALGAAVDCGPVRLWASPLPLLTRAFVPGHVGGRSWIVWPAREARLDFAAPDAPLRDQADLVHELVHVHQAQGGANMLLAKLRAGDGDAAYDYGPVGGPPWEKLNIEQQATLVEHAFLARRGVATPWPASAYAAVVPFRPEGGPLERA